MTIKIKNWENFQHYKDRCPPWIKLHRRLLDDREFFKLNGECVKTLVLLWILAAETTGGELPPLEDVAFRLRIDSSVLAKHLTILNHWVISDASDMLAECKRIATSETENRERERDKDRVEISAPARDLKPKRKAILPESWEPNEKHRILSVELGVCLDTQLDAFRDYEAAHVRRMADWDACFRTWLKKSAEFSPGRFRGGLAKKTPQQQSLDAIEKWRNEDDDAIGDSRLSQDLGDRVSRAVPVGRQNGGGVE